MYGTTKRRRYKEKVARIHGRTVQKKGLNNLDNQDGVINHLEPDILECEVKWALGSMTMNKASGGGRIPAELFHILKDDDDKQLHSMCQQLGKLSNGHRTGKGQFSFQSPKKGNSQECSNYYTSCTHSQSSKVMLKILQARLQ